jgi:hypothetical protein
MKMNFSYGVKIDLNLVFGYNLATTVLCFHIFKNVKRMLFIIRFRDRSIDKCCAKVLYNVMQFVFR